MPNPLIRPERPVFDVVEPDGFPIAIAPALTIEWIRFEPVSEDDLSREIVARTLREDKKEKKEYPPPPAFCDAFHRGVKRAVNWWDNY